jgi:ABC-type sugar transport system ATPase subunit
MNYLEMKNIAKNFGAINALQGVDFSIKAATMVRVNQRL